MSTYIYLECLEHDPPTRSADEVGQHLTDLPRIRAEVADREFWTRLMNRDDPVSIDGYFTRNAAWFLAQHPKCRLRIMDEYGREHPLTVEPEAKPRPVAEGEWEPTRWHRVTYLDEHGVEHLWAESSDADEIKNAALNTPAGSKNVRLEHLWRRESTQWRPEE